MLEDTGWRPFRRWPGSGRLATDYLDGQQAVLYRSELNPFLGRNFEAMDPLEWE